MRSLSPDTGIVSGWCGGRRLQQRVPRGLANGRSFFAAREGLRGRRPDLIEWKGAVRGSGDEVAPVDLRIDHVYLVSCKYLSNILFNASPHMSSILCWSEVRRRRGRGIGGDWYAEVAPHSTNASTLRSVQPSRRRPAGRRIDRPTTVGGSAESGEVRLPGLEMADHAGWAENGAVARHSMAALRELPPLAIDLTSAHRPL